MSRPTEQTAGETRNRERHKANRRTLITLAALWGACQMGTSCITDEQDEQCRKIWERLQAEHEEWEIDLICQQIAGDALTALGVR